MSMTQFIDIEPDIGFVLFRDRLIPLETQRRCSSVTIKSRRPSATGKFIKLSYFVCKIGRQFLLNLIDSLVCAFVT